MLKSTFLICGLLVSCHAFLAPQHPMSRIGSRALPARSEFRPISVRRKQGNCLKMDLGFAVSAHAGKLLATSTILGGALAGGLHAITGPDHYPALLPRCVGKRWLAAGKIGAMWGVGHAVSAMAMGLCAFLIKDKAFIPGGFFSKIAFGADVAIGLSLILIGCLSIQEAKGVDFKREIGDARSAEKQTLAMKANVLINGLFHGLSLDGIPTIMPVLGASSLSAAVSFLVSYGLGVTAAMIAATIFIGQGTMSLAKTTDFDLSKMIHGSAVGAVFVGIAWTTKAIFLS